MARDANLLMREFRNRLVKDIESSGLPSGVCLYVVKDVAQELSGIYSQNCQTAAKKEADEARKTGDENG